MAPAALLALFLLQPVGAGASAADPSPLGRCLDRSEAAAGAMPAIAACIEAEIVRRDRVLNAVYRARLARSGRAARARLVAAERRWIIRRDAACLPTNASQDAAIAARWCLLDRTEARIAALSRG